MDLSLLVPSASACTGDRSSDGQVSHVRETIPCTGDCYGRWHMIRMVTTEDVYDNIDAGGGCTPCEFVP